MQHQRNMNQFLGLCLLGFLSTIFACQDGWQSYNGHCYKLFPTTNRQAAANGCEAEGAYLACVENQNENRFIAAEVANNRRAFLGHTDEGSEGVWRCTDVNHISPVWWRGEPNNCCGGENCAEINFGGRYMWNDVRCGARFPSVCEKDGPCEPGWVGHDGHCYLKVDSSVNFDEAEINCVANSAHLVCIDSQDENDFVADLADGRRSWIGHTDGNHERIWMCTSEDGTTIPTDWRTASNEPNNCCGGEHCAEINFIDPGLWNDLSCGASLPYVCEKPEEQENSASLSCEDGWTLHNDKCYKLFPSATHDSASSQCRQDDASVVCINNRAENDYITRFTNGQRSWIAHVDKTTEGIWRCDSQNTDLGQIWWTNEPNNCCSGEDCAEINFGGRARWNDNNCNAGLAFVCEKEGPCESGWNELGTQCYLYRSDHMSWTNAMRQCQTLNGYLACIGDSSENNFVAEMAGGNRAWVGSTDEGHEGAWMCAGEDGSESHWWRGEPNNCCSGENCAEINFGAPGRWNDVGCGASFPFVCEKSARAGIEPCEFVTNFFSHCVTDSRDECAALVTSMATLENGCDSNREFLGGMTGLCALEERQIKVCSIFNYF